MLKMYTAGYYRHLGNQEKCLRTVYDGLEISDRYGVHFLDHMIIVRTACIDRPMS